ncbi:CRISPR system precrRNA processing endoribonuclease RAMP protein Cas6 [Fuchsiella alkaliacetigena]|uniref:CRISPR system precrRNA processing endoribonuclease RAMP protein Cas6 n=1 Tax=Fuchsiella alkaliacetigena TaxID=957042 RepID=UPI00200A731A|nr:CRISPR system precrRNA processing endoribonuclease RAMP protein Cas6 [Fuchsiella alkaliacetigena]MCK8825372.1 CRISPR system precrRNA processing endoribonuclease RAMP protein Cas6 [Fuchsiella alkaliacetigena]
MQLLVTQLSFTLIASQKIKLPAYPGSTFRGALGHALKNLTCNVDNVECKDCNLNQMCAYAQLFNPHLTEKEKHKSSKRFNNKPRPFVFEPQTNGQELFKSGQQINFNLNLFGYTSRFLPYIIESWRLLEKKGLGKGRGQFILSEIWNINHLNGKAERVYSQYANLVHNSDLEINQADIDKLKSSLSKKQLKLRLLTPMLLKYQGDYVKELEFHILMRNLFRRLTSLSLFYGNEELDIDFGAYLKAAEDVKLVEDKTEWQTWQRYSSRQQRKIKMQGLSGEVEYQGELDKFLDYLILGQYIHVGKNTVFGLGDYKLLN